MWSYYGSKSKIIDYYPRPKYNKIIEPFAGSGRYALKYFDKDVLLVDKYEIIVNVWKWLQKCTSADILSLPSIKEKQRIPDSLCIEEKHFISFNCARGTAAPQNVAGSYDNIGSVWESKKKWTAANLHRIKHWEIRLGCYSDIENEIATYFIDSPYQFGGDRYKHNKIDFKQLSEWCKSRNGQSIVCENTKADWLPFRPLINLQGQKFQTTEAIWSNEKLSFKGVQQEMIL